MENNSRQNTRFRWRDAKIMEASVPVLKAMELNSDEKIEISDPVVMDEDVKFEGKIIDKNGQEVLAGGGGESNVFTAEYGETTLQELEAAFAAGKEIHLHYATEDDEDFLYTQMYRYADGEGFIDYLFESSIVNPQIINFVVCEITSEDGWMTFFKPAESKIFEAVWNTVDSSESTSYEELEAAYQAGKRIVFKGISIFGDTDELRSANMQVDDTQPGRLLFRFSVSVNKDLFEFFIDSQNKQWGFNQNTIPSPASDIITYNYNSRMKTIYGGAISEGAWDGFVQDGGSQVNWIDGRFLILRGYNTNIDIEPQSGTYEMHCLIRPSFESEEKLLDFNYTGCDVFINGDNDIVIRKTDGAIEYNLIVNRRDNVFMLTKKEGGTYYNWPSTFEHAAIFTLSFFNTSEGQPEQHGGGYTPIEKGFIPDAVPDLPQGTGTYVLKCEDGVMFWELEA